MCKPFRVSFFTCHFQAVIFRPTAAGFHVTVHCCSSAVFSQLLECLECLVQLLEVIINFSSQVEWTCMMVWAPCTSRITAWGHQALWPTFSFLISQPDMPLLFHSYMYPSQLSGTSLSCKGLFFPESDWWFSPLVVKTWIADCLFHDNSHLDN